MNDSFMNLNAIFEIIFTNKVIFMKNFNYRKIILKNISVLNS